MKIAILCTPRDVHACKWAEALHQAGAEVLFICPEPEARQLSYCRVIPIPGRVPGQWNYADFWFSGKVLGKVLEFERPTIVCALHVTPFGVWARISGYKPFIVMALGADILEYTGKRPLTKSWDSEWKKSFLRKWMNFYWHKFQVKKTLVQANSIYADNSILKTGIAKLMPAAEAKTKQFSWGIDPKKWLSLDTREKDKLRDQYNLPRDKKIVLSPRGMKPVYQPEILLEAIELARANSAIYWILLKGNYEIPDEVLKKIRSENLGNLRFVEETLPEEIVQDYFALSDILISIPVYDGLSASVLQAFSCGLHPILSDIPASRELRALGLNLSLLLPANGQELLNNIVSWYSEKADYVREIEKKHNRNWVEQNADICQQVRWFLQQNP